MKRELQIGLKIKEESDWKIAYFREGGTGVTVVDSRGSSCSGMKSDYSVFFSSGCRIRNERILLSTESWLPSAEAKWIEVKGNLPFVVSRDSSVSENVVLKLVEDFSAPLVLKGAALDGGDVNVMLKVDSLRPNPLRKGTLSVTISMSSEAPVGFLDFEVQRTDGTAILGKCGGEKDRNSARKHGWRQFLVLDGTHDEEVIVAVKYLVRLKEAVVPVHGRSGLFGTVAKEKVQPGRN
ncbi:MULTISPECIES: hypothetical protein [unclassified Akkermansia]|uniref:hypothetical protein n=1 Tax=unclassified Akkermansia TaxID=2608915 RepID=UPI0025E9C76E|nr:hypothetical protein [uncultured Akkermansia sp.]